MASKARNAFDKNAADIHCLLELRQQLMRDDKNDRSRREVLNKSAVVLITAFWEAYCEDLAAEAQEHITNRTPQGSWPREVLKKFGTTHDLKKVLEGLKKSRDTSFGSPESGEVDKLFRNALELPSISTAWNWEGMDAERARKRLDQFVGIRHEIAHRGNGAKSIDDAQVDDYFGHVRELARLTGGKVNAVVQSRTGRPLWSTPPWLVAVASQRARQRARRRVRR